MEYTQITEKHCTKCGTVQPIAAFSKDRSRKDGLSLWCKPCANASSKGWAKANPDKKAAGNRAHHRANPEKGSARFKAWKQNNPDKKAASDRAWRKANPEKVAAKRAKWERANPEKVAATIGKWARANPDRVSARNQARRTSKLQALPAWADKEAIAAIYTKAREWSAILGVELHVDHVVPLKSPLVQGLHCPDNLQILAAADNIRKGNRYWPDMPGDMMGDMLGDMPGEREPAFTSAGFVLKVLVNAPGPAE